MGKHTPINLDELKALGTKDIFNRLSFLTMCLNKACVCENGKLCINCEIEELQEELKQRWELNE